MHLHERNDLLFNMGNLWCHRTLRTVFDPYCAEWDDTDMTEKIFILQKLLNHGEDLEMIFEEFKNYYRHSTKPYVANDAHKGLARIAQALLERLPAISFQEKGITAGVPFHGAREKR